MAKQTSFFLFTGKLGNVIGYQRNGRHFLRSAPDTVGQTANTRRAARRFGIASKKGALIRRAIMGELDITCDGSYVNRLNKALILAGKDMPLAITGFRLNEQTGIDRFFSIAPGLTDERVLYIPSQKLSSFPGVTALEVKVIATRISFVRQQIVSTDVIQVLIDPHQPFTGIQVPLNAPGTGTLIITVQIRCLLNGHFSANTRYTAADIITVKLPSIQKDIHHTIHAKRGTPPMYYMRLPLPGTLYTSSLFIQRE